MGKSRSKNPAAEENNDLVPSEERGHIKHVVMREEYSGPIPHPETIRLYEEVFPGAAKIIFELAQSQARHRQELEKIAISSGARDSAIGIVCGFILGMTAICGGVLCILKGFQWGGGIIGTGGLSGLVGVFVYGTRSRRQERETKARQID